MAFMQNLPGNAFSEIKFVHFSELCHVPNGLGARRRLPSIARERSNGCFDELFNRPDEASINGFLYGFRRFD